jgi:26S proteasome regulatory subunit N2
VLRLIIKLYESVESPEWVNICMCLMLLNDHNEVANILQTLIQGSEVLSLNSLHSVTCGYICGNISLTRVLSCPSAPHTQDETLLAYQVSFDLFENEMQSFLLKVRTDLDQKYQEVCGGSEPAASAAEAPQPEGAGGEGEGEGMDTDAVPPAAAPVVEDSPQVKQYKERFGKLKGIITGKTPIGLYLEFLYSHNHADLQVLKNIKGAVESRNSVCHSAAIVANALMHCGTTVDTFLRDNLEWLSRATNWAKFSATAGLGVIHKGHLTQVLPLASPRPTLSVSHVHLALQAISGDELFYYRSHGVRFFIAELHLSG